MRLLYLLPVLLLFSCEQNSDNINEDNGVVSPPVELPRYDFDNPEWHPDGRWIAVHHTDSIDSDGDGLVDTLFPGIWLVDAQTGEKQPLLGNGFYRQSWSPDGRMLAVEGNNFQIFTVEMASLDPPLIDTTTIRQLTFKARSFSAAWSSDGEWIAYMRSICEGPSTCGTWLMDTEGNQKRFLFLGVSSLGISWHPFDPLILFTRTVWAEDGAALGDTVELFDIRTNIHRSIRFLSDPNYQNYDIQYSPDGRKIAFVSMPRGGPPVTIWIMNSDGTHLRQLTEGWEWGLSFSVLMENGSCFHGATPTSPYQGTESCG